MNQSTGLQVVSPTGDVNADRTLLAGIREYLARHEAINTIQLSGFFAADRFDSATTVLVVLQGPAIVAIATYLGSFNMLLSHVEHDAAADALVEAVIARNIEIPGVMGVTEFARAFAERWSERTGRAIAPGMARRILATSALNPLAKVPGSSRTIEPTDRPFLIEWFAAFGIEADGVASTDSDAYGRAMLDRLGPKGGGLVWLDREEAPVSVACYQGPTQTGIRIGPVYTPPLHRGCGYAAAVTAVTTQRMLDRGYAFVCLYTDAANATSNHVYERIGYQFVTDSMQYRFHEANHR